MLKFLKMQFLPRIIAINVGSIFSCPNSYCYSLYYLVFAQCAQGKHERKTEYGMCGVITAIVSFKIIFEESIIHYYRLSLTLVLIPVWSDLFVVRHHKKL